jgi:hypothetical protein
MASWMDTAAFVASDPGRVAIVIGLAQADQALDELTLAQMAGMLVQRIAGQPVETAVIVKHITDLAGEGLLERDDAGFRWQLTALGTLVSRQWAPGNIDPPGNNALHPAEIRAWRDRMLAQLEDDGTLAQQAGVEHDELLAVQGGRLTELRVLNRVLGEEELPGWLWKLAQERQAMEQRGGDATGNE